MILLMFGTNSKRKNMGSLLNILSLLLTAQIWSTKLSGPQKPITDLFSLLLNNGNNLTVSTETRHVRKNERAMGTAVAEKAS